MLYSGLEGPRFNRASTASLREQVARGLLLASWCYGGLIIWKAEARRVFGVRAPIIDDVFLALAEGGLMCRTGNVSKGGTEWTIVAPEAWPGWKDRFGFYRESMRDLPPLCRTALHRAYWNLKFDLVDDESGLVQIDSEPRYISDGQICVGPEETGMVWRRGLFAHLRNGRYLHFRGAPPGGIADVTEVVLAELKALEGAFEREMSCYDTDDAEEYESPETADDDEARA